MERPLALELGHWAATRASSGGDRELADAALLDTVCVALAAREHPIAEIAGVLGSPGQWAAMAHALDYDDLHLPSISHISAICVPAALARAGGSAAYLAGAGVMARIGTLLGWRHYDAGWHTTATAGVFGAAAAAAVSLGLSAERTAAAIALSVSAASGVQRAFGSDAKPLQVGMAVRSGIAAAELAARGARPDLTAFDAWLDLVSPSGGDAMDGTEAIPGGLAVKIFPCCYALQRPIFAVREICRGRRIAPEAVLGAEVRAPVSTVKPLIHHRPTDGAQGKFSLEYGVAAALLDGFPDQWSFSDVAVRRPAAQELLPRVRFLSGEPGRGLLDGECEIALELAGGDVLQAAIDVPEGAPGRPPSPGVLAEKAAGCLSGLDLAVSDIDWGSAAALLAAHAPTAMLAELKREGDVG
ncbi:MAG TPA: MmgE/PrpD family protein [Solirubrobacteraceae bacterium]|nr:MmgE/PrpD family protein [Solirubrobacteraceae bacterium]